MGINVSTIENEEADCEKVYYTYDDIHDLVKEGYTKLEESDFKPDYILAIGGGGLIPARILRTYIDVPILVTTLNYYEGESQTPCETPNIIQMVDLNMIKDKNVLIVDEVDDTRNTLKYVINNILENTNTNLGIFVIHNKNNEKTIDFTDETLYIACEETEGDKWIEYPWECK